MAYATPQQMIVPSNLGSDFAFDTANRKIHVNIDNSSITMDGSGVLHAKMGPSADAGDLLTRGSDGLPYLSIAQVLAAEPAASLAFNSGNNSLAFTNAQGTVTNIDLTPLVTDLTITNATWDAATTTLTLLEADGGKIRLDLSTLAASSVAATSTVTLSGTGVNGNPLTARVNISQTTQNVVVANADGIYVPQGAGLTATNFGQTVRNTIVNGSISSDVVIDNTTIGNNMLVTNGAGVGVYPLRSSDASDGSLDVAVTGGPNGGQVVTGSVNVSNIGYNQVSKQADGIYVAPVQVASGNGITLSRSFDANNVETITANANMDPSGRNLATSSASGLFVDSNNVIATVFNLEVQDAFGMHLGWMDLGTASAP